MPQHARQRNYRSVLRHVAVAAALAMASGGCLSWWSNGNFVPPEAAFAPPPVVQINPALFPVPDRDLLWNQLVDVVDDYFKVQRERRVRQEGDLLTEGVLDTYPRTGSTIFEPWNGDSSTRYERVESTLQSIQRRCQVRVIPASGGFLVDVAVFKELEDVPRPENFNASAANLRNDSSNRRLINPIGGEEGTLGWIPLGRDVALEQRIITQLQARLGVYSPPLPQATPLPPGAVPGGFVAPPGYVPGPIAPPLETVPGMQQLPDPGIPSGPAYNPGLQTPVNPSIQIPGGGSSLGSERLQSDDWRPGSGP